MEQNFVGMAQVASFVVFCGGEIGGWRRKGCRIVA